MSNLEIEGLDPNLIETSPTTVVDALADNGNALADNWAVCPLWDLTTTLEALRFPMRSTDCRTTFTATTSHVFLYPFV